MKRLAYLLCVAVAGSAGCQAITGQTLTEELPGSASVPTGGQPTNGIVTNPVPVPVPTPEQPAPAPQPTPAPNNPAPQPTAQPTPQPAPQPTPTPDNSGAPAFHKLRVAFFGVSCRNGKQEPNNGARQVPVGCIGHVTATPKNADNTDVPPSIHGPNITWELRYGGNAVEIKESIFPNDFNRDVHGKRQGDWMLCARVKNVEGCMAGTVTP